MQQTPSIDPVFLDYDQLIHSQPLQSGIELDYIHNTKNPTFSLDYIVEMGKYHDPLLPLAINYLTYLGTEQYSCRSIEAGFFPPGSSLLCFHL